MSVNIQLDKIIKQKEGTLKGSIFNTSISAGANIFGSDLSPSSTVSIFRIYCAFASEGVLSVARTKGGTTITEKLNEGESLFPNCAYIFDILVESGETINFRYSTATTCLVLKVVEIPVGV